MIFESHRRSELKRIDFNLNCFIWADFEGDCLRATRQVTHGCEQEIAPLRIPPHTALAPTCFVQTVFVVPQRETVVRKENVRFETETDERVKGCFRLEPVMPIPLCNQTIFSCF